MRHNWGSRERGRGIDLRKVTFLWYLLNTKKLDFLSPLKFGFSHGTAPLVRLVEAQAERVSEICSFRSLLLRQRLIRFSWYVISVTSSQNEFTSQVSGSWRTRFKRSFTSNTNRWIYLKLSQSRTDFYSDSLKFEFNFFKNKSREWIVRI